MRALTLHPWWAWLVASGHKPTENRSWAPSLRPGETIAIHAGARRPSRDDRARVADQLQRAGLSHLLEEVLAAPRSAIVGTVVYAGHDERMLSVWDVAPTAEHPVMLHWRVCSAQQVAPIPCSGALGLWRLSEAHEALLMPNACAPA